MPWGTDNGFNILTQEHVSSCGLCCCAMVQNLFDSDYKPSEQRLIAISSQIDSGGYSRATRDIPGAQATFAVAAAKKKGVMVSRENYGDGTYANHLADILRREFKLTANKFGGDNPDGGLKSYLQGASRTTPVIVRIGWGAKGDGGGHWVVIVGRATRGLMKSSDYSVLDPLSKTVIVSRGSVSYKSPHGDGLFTGWGVRISRGGATSAPAHGGVKLPGM